MKQVSIGVDIGESGVKLIQCAGGEMRRVVSEPLPENLTRDGHVLSTEAMGAFLKETAAKHHITGRRCALVVPSSQSFTRRTVMPAMTVEQLKVNLPYEFRDYISQEKEKYVYDYALLEMTCNEDGTPQQMELMITAALKSTMQEYRDMFRQAGLRLVLAAPEEFCYAALLRAYGQRNPLEADREHCLIDLGYLATRVHIYAGDRFEATRVVDAGSAALDAVIADALHVDEHVAQSYRLANHENCLALEPCRAIYRSVALDIMRAVNFYGYNNPTSALEWAWLCGGGSCNPYLLDTLQDTLNLELRPAHQLLPSLPENRDIDLALYPAVAGVILQEETRR